MSYSQAWPKAGCLRSGAVCARPTLARHIAGIAGGASPGTESNWPTPDGGMFGNQPNANTTQWDGRNTLISYAPYWSEKLWATPNAGGFNDAEPPEQWRARQATLKEKGINGNGAGVPLSIMAQESTALWATPNAVDYKGPNPLDRQRVKGNRDLSTDVALWGGPASRPAPATATAGAPSSNGTPTSRLQLNALFVEALMGLPPTWVCACARESISSGRSETPSSSSKQRQL